MLLNNLFSQMKVGTMELKNRIAMAPMTLGFESKDGTINEKLIDFWEARAKGGVGLIIVDVVTVDNSVPYLGNTIGLGSDEAIPSFRRFASKMHEYGTKVIPQISHPGPESISWAYGVPPVGPSAYPNQFGKLVRELNEEEIVEIIEKYGDAARRAREAGCDGVELHCAHAYMLAGSFLSPLRNKRTDKYGGNLYGRARFTIEVIKNIKAKAGNDFPIIMRISGDEKVPGGNTLSDMLYIIPKFVEAGVDGFEVSGGTQYEACWKIIPCQSEKVGVNVDEARAIKKVAGVPIIVVGKINDTRYAEEIIKNGYADGVVMGRALLADPELPRKAMEGRFDDIAPCTSCGVGCLTRDDGRTTATCVINPEMGKEKEMKILPALKKKRVFIIGGGIAAMEAARVAAIRGHEVTIFEKGSKLGGQINLASIPPFKQELTKWAVYLTNQLGKAGVRVELNKEMTCDMIKEQNPDAVILATGAEPFIPPLKGVGNDRVVLGNDVLTGKEVITSGNIIVIGGGMIGCEVAETMFHNARGPMSVTIVEMMDKIAADVCPNNQLPMLQRLYSSGVRVFTSTKVKEITDQGVLAEINGKDESLGDFDKIVICCGGKSLDNLSAKLMDDIPEVYVIGDAKSPRKALQAVHEGSLIAREI